jgi:fibronectin-binding autotransporter adhesin
MKQRQGRDGRVEGTRRGVALCLAGLTSLLMGVVAVRGQETRTWVGTTAAMTLPDNWSPVGMPSAELGDSMLFDGSSEQNAPTFPYNSFSTNNGLGGLTVTAGQTAALTINCSGGTGTDIFRLLPGADVTVAAGAGAFSMGTGGSSFLLNLGRNVMGNAFLNDSGNLARMGSRVSINVTGGPGGRAVFGGAGDWLVDASFTASVNLGLIKVGSGTVTLRTASNLSGACAVSNGTLVVIHPNALGTGVFTIMDVGTLDLASLPGNATVANALSGAGRLRVRGNQNVTLNNLTPALLTLEVDVSGLSVGTHTILKKSNTTFDANTFAATAWLNQDGMTVAFDYATPGELRLTVQAVPDAVVWTGGSAEDSLWSTPENWTDDTLPVAGSRLVFAGAATPRPVSTHALAENRFHSLSLADQQWTLSGAALTLGRIELDTAHVAVVGTPLTLIGEAGVQVAAGGRLELTGIISGERALVKSGPGIYRPATNNSYRGGTEITEGTVWIGHNNAFGTGPVTFLGNADIEVRHNDTAIPNRLVVSAGVTARLRRYQVSNSTARFGGGLSGSGTLEIGGQFGSAEFGTRFNGDNTGFTGTLRIKDFAEYFVEDMTAAQNGNVLPNGVLELTGGNVKLDIDGNRTYHIGTLSGATASQASYPTIRAWKSGRVATLSVGGRNEDSLFAGRIIDGVGAVALTKVGLGRLTLTGGNTYSGVTTVVAGTLRAEGAADAPQPLGFWPMDEGSGSTIASAVPGAPAGTLYNNPGWVEGPRGTGTYAVGFDGVTQYGLITSSAHPALHTLGAGPLSMSAWVKTTHAGVWYRSIVSKFGGAVPQTGAPFWGLGWRNANELGFVVRTAANNQTAAHTGSAAIDGIWHHLLGVREADNTLRIYLDGNLHSSVAGPAGSCSNSVNIAIAFHSTLGSGCVPASIAGVGIWQEALTPEQVRAVYGSVLPRNTALRVASGAAVELANVRQSVGSLADQGGGGGSVVLEDAEFTVGLDHTGTTFSGTVSGTGTLVKTGAGMLTLNGGTVDVTGGLTVLAGVFALENGAVLGSACTNIVVSGGTLAISHSDALSAAATVALAGAGQVELAEGVDQKVERLLVDGNRQPAGTYGSTASSAQFKNDLRYAGTGVLRIIPEGLLIMMR